MAKKTLFTSYSVLIAGAVIVILIVWLWRRKSQESTIEPQQRMPSWQRYHWIGCNGCISEGITEEEVSKLREGWAGMHAKQPQPNVKPGDRIEVVDDAGWSGTYTVKGLGNECETTAGITSPGQKKYPALIVFDKIWYCSKHPKGRSNKGGNGGKYRIV